MKRPNAIRANGTGYLVGCGAAFGASRRRGSPLTLDLVQGVLSNFAREGSFGVAGVANGTDRIFSQPMPKP